MTQSTSTRRRTVTGFAVSFGLIVLVAALPIISVLTAEFLANSQGCTLNEGSSYPCMIGGSDRGELLYAMFVMGWFMLFTLPLGMLALVVWVVAAFVVWANSPKRDKIE